MLANSIELSTPADNMYMPRTLKNPPIREAIFTITFKDNVPQEKLNKFLESDFVKNGYPASRQGFKIDITATGKDHILSHDTDGFSLLPGEKGNKNRLIKVTRSYLSFHNLNKYDGWEVMILELKHLWTDFCKAAGRNLLSELRVRNINHINLPLPLEQGFKPYITLLPMIPQGINPTLANFFLQIQTSDPQKKLNATISESILGLEKDPAKLNLLLDITVYKKGTFECNEEEMWTSFDELREFKDDIFFKCITPKTLQLFDNDRNTE